MLTRCDMKSRSIFGIDSRLAWYLRSINYKNVRMDRKLKILNSKSGSRRGSSFGLTLVEILISIVILTILISAMVALFMATQKAWFIDDALTEMQQNLRIAVDELSRDLRMTGYGVDVDTNQSVPQPKICYADPYQIVFNANTDQENPIWDAMSVGSSVPGGLYTPTVNYQTGAETIRYTLDSNADGIVDVNDNENTIATSQGRVPTGNPYDYYLIKEINGGLGETGEVATNIRGWGGSSDTYPNGARPIPIFQYWGYFDADTDEDLWGDTNGNGQLEQSEVIAWEDGVRAVTYPTEDNGAGGGIAGNGRLDPGSAEDRNNNGLLDLSLDDVLTRVGLTLIAETGDSNPDYANPARSSAGNPYHYYDAVVTTIISPRNLGAPAMSLPGGTIPTSIGYTGTGTGGGSSTGSGTGGSGTGSGTGTATGTSTGTATSTSTSTSIPPGACPELTIENPTDGQTLCTPFEFRAYTYDPDNAGAPNDGAGINNVVFKVYSPAGTLIQTQTEYQVQYCGCGGDNCAATPCNPLNFISQGGSGMYTLQVLSTDNGNCTTEKTITVWMLDDFTDDFNDGSALDGNPVQWTDAAGSWSVAGGIYKQTSTGTSPSPLSYVGCQNWTNYTVSARVNMLSAPSNDYYCYIVFRLQNSTNYYLFGLKKKANITRFGYVLNGNYTDIATASFNSSPNTWYTLMAEVNGSSVKCYINGILYINSTTSGPGWSSGQVGLRTYNTRVDFDDFSVNIP